MKPFIFIILLFSIIYSQDDSISNNISQTPFITIKKTMGIKANQLIFIDSMFVENITPCSLYVTIYYKGYPFSHFVCIPDSNMNAKDSILKRFGIEILNSNYFKRLKRR
jgi:hypothetical protein